MTIDRLQGLTGSAAFKLPVRAATTAAVTLSGEQTVDGVALVAGDRVLVKDQPAASENGVWVVATGAWSRGLDFNGARDVVTGTQVFVTSGATNGSRNWSLTTTGTISIGVTPLIFAGQAASVGLDAPLAQNLGGTGSTSLSTAQVTPDGGLVSANLALLFGRDLPAISVASSLGGGGDDTANLLTALQTGRVIDGMGKTFRVAGGVAPGAGFRGLVNATIRETASTTTPGLKTLHLTNSGFVLRDITIDRGTDVTTPLYDADPNGALDSNFALLIQGPDRSNRISQFEFSGITVRGHGSGTMFCLQNAEKFGSGPVTVHSASAKLAAPLTDDILQGIRLSNVSDHTFADLKAYDLLTDWQDNGTYGNARSRGIVLDGCDRVTLMGPTVRNVEQAIDLTGSLGNNECIVSEPSVFAAGTVGVKLANTAARCQVRGGTLRKVGWYGVLISGDTEVGSPPCYGNVVDGVALVDIGIEQSLTTANAKYGVLIARGDNVGTAPYECSVRNVHLYEVDHPGLVCALVRSTVDTTQPLSGGYNDARINWARGCWGPADIPVYSGSVGPCECLLRGTSTQSVSDSSWTDIGWDDAGVDPHGLHSLSTNIASIYPKIRGAYRARATIRFASNGTGVRGARLLLNGNPVAAAEDIKPAVAGAVTTITVEARLPVEQGNNIRVQAYQTSGGALDIDRAASELAVILTDA